APASPRSSAPPPAPVGRSRSPIRGYGLSVRFPIAPAGFPAAGRNRQRHLAQWWLPAAPGATADNNAALPGLLAAPSDRPMLPSAAAAAQPFPAAPRKLPNDKLAAPQSG